MTTIKTALAAVFAVLSLSAAAPAAELNTLGKADVARLTADLRNPEPALREAVEAKAGLDPVVITVPGLSFGEIGPNHLELKYVLKLIKKFFPGKTMSEEDLINTMVAFDKDYFFPSDDEDVRDLAEASRARRMPDNYLEAKLREIPGFDKHDVVIVPFAWSRDPGDTEKTLPELEKKIAETYDKYKATGRPIYILAHSWGSVMTHTALHRVEAARPDVKINKLITAGSPLIPANFVVKLFVALEVKKEHLEKAVTKPGNVEVWRNIWASRDAYSNEIPAADGNVQVDAAVENLEPTLIDLILHNKLFRRDAKRDLFKMRDIKAWHGSYFFDYDAYLASLKKEIKVQVFRPVLAPQVVDCAKAEGPVCPI